MLFPPSPQGVIFWESLGQITPNLAHQYNPLRHRNFQDNLSMQILEQLDKSAFKQKDISQPKL